MYLNSIHVSSIHYQIAQDLYNQAHKFVTLQHEKNTWLQKTEATNMHLISQLYVLTKLQLYVILFRPCLV